MSLPLPAEPHVEAPPPVPQPAARLHPLLRFVLYLICFMVLNTIGLLLATTFQPWIETAVGPQLPEASDTLFVLLGFAFTAILLVPVTGLFLRDLDRLTFADMAACWPRGGAAAALRQLGAWAGATALVLGLWLALVVAGVRLLGGDFRFAGWHPDLLTGPALWPGLAGSGLLLLAYLVGFAVQGSVEEWVFRGYLQRTLKQRWSWPVSATLGSVFFALGHAGNPSASVTGMLNTFLVGFTFALLVEVTGSLWGACVTHGVWNFLVSTWLSLPVSGVEVFPVFQLGLDGPEWFTGGAYGPEASAVLTVLLVAINAWLWRLKASQPPAGGAAAGSG